MLYDAHNHLHDRRLRPNLGAILKELAQLPLAAAVVNGTRESDWPEVADLAATYPWVRPAFGVHPWQVPTRSENWLKQLCRQLDANPEASVGEVGLDRWVEGHDINDQTNVFRAQLAVAADRGVPVTIHCIKAWGALWDIIRSDPLPARGFLIHAYGGPEEMIQGFVDQGAYFSFSPYFLHDRKAAQRDAFRKIPAERLLVETDAPDLRPPDERNTHPLVDAEGQQVNHPANLSVSYTGLAEIRELSVADLSSQVRENFERLFGKAHPAAPVTSE